ncbi:holo-[acyl-carrier-protein] synthase [Geomonas subterranea]|uniref:Holo-[acyl-carrier-protein] synthase n=1 Tax=Geomonas subterranea TaxID=2847989 RepID=A0ABX8LGE7_9BACT|nr:MULTISPECIES: holo-[acyl-carrier-protein] synthase [Geomonas]QXE91098.1 holo-[acyl-carrier-protein] synthase [Geomonas subterranea]QXM10814.1 holo-[acyl-carrier-protein] synthase [Geomonas subterranea]
MIYGTGVDIVEIARFDKFLKQGNDALFQRIFTQNEIAYCSAKKHAAQHYALRFGAKEAFLKALGTGLRGGLSWQDMEVVNDELGKPTLRLAGRAGELFREAGLCGCFLSLSHDAGCAVAMVVLER